jgi:hypothetical protein
MLLVLLRIDHVVSSLCGTGRIGSLLQADGTVDTADHIRSTRHSTGQK